ncbi:MAG: PEGA domain-containing protein [Methanoregula sp.]
MKHQYLLLVILGMTALLCFPPASAEEVSGDQGWYVIHCDVYGANVYLDDKFIGTVPQGPMTIPVNITSPYKKLTVKKTGYSTFVDSITKVPVKGDMVDLYATLRELPSATPAAIIGDVGWYVVHCNVDGATVVFDATEKGEISQGVVYVPVYSTTSPFHSYTVKKDGYTSFTGTIERVPLRGESVDLYGSINPADASTATPIIDGGDIGWYKIHANVDGATVTFDKDVKGKIAKGVLSVQVFVTGTPYRAFTVSKAGFEPYTGTIARYPAKGQTVDLYATLNANPEITTSVPITKASLPPAIAVVALIFVGVGIGISARIRK